MTRAEFEDADGSELIDTPKRPAKMRALLSSSALAVNFFDAWRSHMSLELPRALGFDSSPKSIRFEYQPEGYPVGRRTPNLDVLITLESGKRVAVESKFAEPYRAPGADALLSPKYFAKSRYFWEEVGLTKAQELAFNLRARWEFLDVAQLLKHMLGLASDQGGACTLLYLWFDTQLPDAKAHLEEIRRFRSLIAGDAVTFESLSYQEAFRQLDNSTEPKYGWRDYMRARYFAPA